MKIVEIDKTYIHIDTTQPRKKFDGIGNLADNIRKQGLISPIEVIKVGKNKYQIVDGERRYKAILQISAMKTIPCIIKNDAKDILLRQLITDFQKHKLNDVEKSDSVERLEKDGYDKHEITHLLGISDSLFYHLKRIGRLNDNTKKLIAEGKLSPNVIRKLALYGLHPKKEDAIIREIVERKLKDEHTIRKIVLSKQDFIYMVNTFSTDIFAFNKKIRLFNRILKEEANFIDEQIKTFSTRKNKECNESVESLWERMEKVVELLKKQKKLLRGK